jgi:hypothetical protein
MFRFFQKLLKIIYLDIGNNVTIGVYDDGGIFSAGCFMKKQPEVKKIM